MPTLHFSLTTGHGKLLQTEVSIWNENSFFIIPQEAGTLRPMPPPPGLAREKAVDFNGFATLR
jgi:hypothetical protein